MCCWNVYSPSSTVDPGSAAITRPCRYHTPRRYRAASKLCCKRWSTIINTSTKLLTQVHLHEADQAPSLLRWLRAYPSNAIDTLDMHCHFPLCDLGTEMYAILEAIQPGQLQVLVADVDRIAAAPWDRFMKLRVLKVVLCIAGFVCCANGTTSLHRK